MRYKEIDEIEKICYCKDINHTGGICPIGKEYAKRVRGIIAAERASLPQKVYEIGKLKAKVKRLGKAMKEIADMKYTDNNDILRAKNIARKALEGE